MAQQPPWLLNNACFFYAFYSLRKNKNTLKAYTDVSKSIGFFAAVFMQTISLKKPPFTVKITAIKIALMEIHKREDKIWVIYTNSQSSIQSIESNKENYPILNQNSITKENR